MKKIDVTENSTTIGIFYAVAAFTLWGLLPLYWRLLNQIPAGEILAHRIFWSFIFLTGILIINSRLNGLKQVIMNSKNLIGISFCAIIISINWGIYIWAINANHIVEASMGYYINPLVSVLLGIIVLKERLDFWQKISLAFASLGVIIIALQYGKIPWIALSLAVTFALYGLVKKLVDIESIVGLTFETAIIMPIAFVYIIFKQVDGMGAIGVVPLSTTLILFGSGIVTATPLLWFAKAARRVPLSTVGFTQYISPTISLFLGIFVFKEQFTKIHFLSFGFIWCGLILYSLSQTGILKNISPKYIERVQEK